MAREAERYVGIAKWYMLGAPETLEAAAEVLATNERIVPLALDPASPEPIWLGTFLKDRPSNQTSRAHP